MKKIRIGQIGVCHEHAAGKILTLRGLPDVFEIVGVVDDRASSKTARFISADFKLYDGLPFMSEETLLGTPGLQAVTVETPNLELVPTALRCMARNLAMHMDKPGGDNLKRFTTLRRGCEERKLPFQMGYMLRGNPAIQFALRAVREKWLGDVFDVEASMSHNYGGAAYQEYLGAFKGGILFNLGCHLIDFAVSMLGRPERITPFLKSVPGFPDAIKNNGLAILEYPHATVTLRACSCEVEGLPFRRLKVCGTKGTVELCPLERFDGKPLQLRLSLLEACGAYASGTQTVDFGVQRDRYADQLLEWAKVINGEMTNPYGADHDILVQDVLLASAGYKRWKG